MRIAIYDGIAETHVVDSFVRALESRGHEVYNTGKIGHGFEFPTGKVQISKLTRYVDRVIEFAPDWVFVFRPASLPIPLLKRIKKHSIKTVAWFSDDPVLFGLTYGSVVQFYDMILHCGSAEVLKFYEDEFGYPTGVNFPFWTDHGAFPTVWGKEDPVSEVMFLGNLQDEVRRGRYFELAKLDASVRLYGNAGNDYFGLSGGFLDTDQEVVAAGARSQIAVNIPQFFSNHRGLRTWFPGVEKLGFFEYPSRVVQYMAMGLPTISIIPGRSKFDTYPEMIVSPDFENASAKIREMLDAGGLASRSAATALRFDKNFSAMSRVLFFEDLVRDDSWRRLTPEERASLFTRYDATEITNTAPKETPVIEIGVQKSERTSGNKLDGAKVLVLTGDELSVGERASTTIRALGNVGANVVHLAESDAQGILVDDPQGIHKYAILVNKLLDRYGKFDGIYVTELDAVLTTNAADLLKDYRIWTVFIDDSGDSGVKRLSRLADNFDVVATSSPYVMDLFSDSYNNLTFLPPYVDHVFLDLVENTVGKNSGLRIQESPQVEEAMAPSFAQDLSLPPRKWSEFQELSLQDLAEELSSDLTFVSFRQTRANPLLPALFPYALASSRFTFVPRLVNQVYSRLVGNVAVQVRSPGEIAAKLTDLTSSPTAQQMLSQGKRESLDTVFSAEWNLRSIAALQPVSSPINKPSASIGGHNPSVEKHGENQIQAPFSIDFSAAGVSLGTACTVSVELLDPESADEVTIAISGNTADFISTTLGTPGVSWRVITKTNATMASLRLRAETSEGKTEPVSVTFEPEKFLAIGQTTNVVVVER